MASYSHMKSTADAIQNFIKQALAEDVGDGDHTSLSTIPEGRTGKAQLLVKDVGILAGVAIAQHIFYEVSTEVKIDLLLEDGAQVHYGDIAFYVEGPVHAILMAERLVLNLMQHMSGIATTTHRVVKQLEGYKTRVLDTRKTTPGLRYFEKLAVQIGGGVNHRFGLYDMILIKDNHVDYAGGVAAALHSAKNYLQKKRLNLPVEIEVRNLTELEEVMQHGGADRILLDNFPFDMLRQAVKLVDSKYSTEASGGITPENVVEYARCGVDYVSMGSLTHSVKSLDMSLKAIK